MSQRHIFIHRHCHVIRMSHTMLSLLCECDMEFINTFEFVVIIFFKKFAKVTRSGLAILTYLTGMNHVIAFVIVSL